MQQQTIGTAQTSSRVAERAAWSPAQFVAGIVGIVYVVVGGIALARTGTDFSNIGSTHASVAWLHFTCLSAIVQLAAGVLLLVSAIGPAASKSASGVLGVASLAWGIIIVADVPRLFLTWGYTRSTGISYIVAGAVLLIGGLASPVFFSRRREVVSGTGQYVDAAPRP
ncbi:MAG TPA: hypothetical protein VHW47_01020 [Acidimicrobiales bacterium]|jgi:hypothetical protein|nr:hypothetical protein [Acidimicrobiales bacterium]